MNETITIQSALEGLIKGLQIFWESIKAHPWVLIIVALSYISKRRKKNH